MNLLDLFTAETPWPDPTDLDALERELQKTNPDAARVVRAYRALCSMPGHMAANYVIAMRRAKKRR